MKAISFRLVAVAVTGFTVGYFTGQAYMDRTIRAHDRVAQAHLKAAVRQQKGTGCEGKLPTVHYRFSLGLLCD